MRDASVSSNHRCGQWKRAEVTETDGRDDLAPPPPPPHKIPCHCHAATLFTDAAADCVTHNPESYAKSSGIPKPYQAANEEAEEKQAHPSGNPGGELGSKYLPTDLPGGDSVKEWVYGVGRPHTQNQPKVPEPIKTRRSNQNTQNQPKDPEPTKTQTPEHISVQ